MAEMLESEEAARRLGVKLSTLYAYVSRGAVVSYPAPQSRRRLFALEDIERLARKARGGKQTESRLTSVVTALTQIHADGPSYRGVTATSLATSRSFEEVAELLWSGAGGPWEPTALGPSPPLPTQDLLRWAVVMAGAADRLRQDRRPEALRQVARNLVATMVDALPDQAPGDPDEPAAPVLELDDGRRLAGTVAGRLAAKLAPTPPAPALVRAVNAALVVLADHELATSTIAARMAASTRADLYNIVLAALGTVAGPLHGGASTLAYGLLVEAELHDVERALAGTLRWRNLVPGFGHPLYPDGDPRVAPLLGLLGSIGTAAERRVIDELIDATVARQLPPPNVDFGLAAVAFAAGLPADAGETIFTVARTAGWTAHALEEFEEPPLRFRARAVYLAPSPGAGPDLDPRPGEPAET